MAFERKKKKNQNFRKLQIEKCVVEATIRSELQEVQLKKLWRDTVLT